MLPNMLLEKGEVEMVGVYPKYMSPQYDVMDGLYLTRKVVAIRAFHQARGIDDVWRKVWSLDKGRYLLRIYGHFLGHRGQTCVVSPCYAQTADIYAKEASGLNRISLLLCVAEGIKILHSLNITHGWIRASNIFLTDDRRPLLKLRTQRFGI
ncbi:hypothetical protein OE88DRAFT_3673 [Heliocybe sulcata]|uniref:Protein kinase domain-containing protein n=1 Tax=Heliocybe sulcata TaxID=5364 RepID=A0A5C3NEL3_9AGAM|nr:hypothetical protein OE88DRAFT_3673 [Heliocybe sulcata]